MLELLAENFIGLFGELQMAEVYEGNILERFEDEITNHGERLVFPEAIRLMLAVGLTKSRAAVLPCKARSVRELSF